MTGVGPAGGDRFSCRFHQFVLFSWAPKPAKENHIMRGVSAVKLTGGNRPEAELPPVERLRRSNLWFNYTA